MVVIYPIDQTNATPQHQKCFKCKGKKKSAEGMVNCSLATCNNYMHVECLAEDVQEIIGEAETWYCSEKCGAAAVEVSKETETALAQAQFKEICDSNRLLMQTVQDLQSKLTLVLDQNKTLNARLQAVNFGSSTKMQISDASLYGTAHDESIMNMSVTQSAIRHTVGQLQQTLLADSNADGASTSNKNQSSDPFQGKTFDETNAATEHAKSAYLLSLKEIRKNLGELPEFNGKGYEFLNFKTKYTNIMEVGKFNDAQMIIKLEKALKGQALEHVRVWLFSPNPNPAKIMKDLETKFYHPNLIMQEALLKITQSETIKRKNREQLEDFKRLVDAYIHVCTTVKESIHLNGRIPGEIEDKLPDSLCEDWLKMISTPPATGSWFEFAKFLENSVRYLKVRLPDTQKLKDNKSKDSKTTKTHVNVTVEGGAGSSSSTNNKRGGKYPPKRSNYARRPAECPIDNCGEPTFRCKEFLKRKFEGRQKLCEDFNLCKKCLRKGHAAVHCPVENLPKCSVNGCSDPKSHTYVLHPPSNDAKAVANVNHIKELGEFSLFLVAVAYIQDDVGKKHRVTVFIDTGSNSSLISQDLYDKLGLKGTQYNFEAEWCAGGVKRTSIASRKTEIVLSSSNFPETNIVLKDILSMRNLKLPKQKQDSRRIKEAFPYLKDVDIPDFEEQRPQILLGLPHRYLTFPSKVVAIEQRYSAVAEYTKLGWVVSAVSPPRAQINTIVRSSEPKVLKGNITLKELHELVQYFINFETLSSLNRDRKYLSAQDERALEVQRATMKIVDGRYEIGFYWKRDDIVLPDNYSTALRRLKSSEASLKKKNLIEWANAHHQQLLSLNFARKATSDDLKPQLPHQRVNYVIGFVVINQNKVPPKPRWVVDTSAEHAGISLNSALVKGPDNLVPLIQALFHFRERKYAVVADVEKMFHQVKIKDEDQQCQRYLWRDCDGSKEPEIYIYNVMLFGPTDSPSKANAVRIEHAKNNEGNYPNASRAAIDSMYMDDLFNSEDTIEEATRTAQDSIEMFLKINWKLVDFRSNCSNVLAKLPNAHVNQNVLLDLLGDDQTALCKVLGIYWNPKKDAFEFKQTAETELRQKSLTENYRPSKRELLSFVMRIFDCLGLISHFIVRGRMILQATWREQTGWDAEISDTIFESWKSWLLKFDEIALLQIPRHYGYHSQNVKSVTLHVFTDAGKDGYAAVCYFRFTFKDDSIRISQILSKSRVAPLKHLTIPKLELKGAVLGVELANVVREQHKRITIEKTQFWTDSEIVLKWIRGFHLNLPSFVAPRIWEIRENSQVENWRYCPSKLNPADEGTKWKDIDFSDESHQWFTGPPFLIESEDNWPEEKLHPQTTTKVVNVMHRKTQKSLYYAGVFEKVPPAIRASWSKYKSFIAFTQVFAQYWITKTHRRDEIDSIPLPENTEKSVDRLDEAEKCILRNIQKDVWPHEYAVVSGGRHLSERHNPCFKHLKPFKGADDLMRCRTRMCTEETIPYDMKCPIILPNSHETVDAIVKHYHEKNHHIGLEATVARLRSRYWILRPRQAVKRAIARCLHCIEMRAKPYQVEMGQLPEFRLTPTTKAFERVGVDCFGPFKVHIGASKRSREIWAVIFTCLVTRAVFLKRINSLTTDEMLLAIQDLWTRRGPVTHMISDNGKNFIGCKNFLTKEVRERIAKDFSLKWTLNPPYTPQWGGAWERLIKDIKRALKAAMGDKTVSERLFDMILLQVEDIINSRPLTNVPASPDDECAITPNLLVKLHPGYSFISDVSQPEDENSRYLIKRARKLTSKFMGRWIKEYLPIITRNVGKSNLKDSIQQGDFVIYCDPVTHPSHWHRGIVCKTYPGRDGRIRLADIKIKGGEIIERRSAYRLAKLDIDNEAFYPTIDDDDSDKSHESLENAFINVFNDYSRNNGRLAPDFKLFLNSLRRVERTLTSSTEKFPQTSFFIEYLNSRKRMTIYNSIDLGKVRQLMAQLNYKKFVRSTDVSRTSADENSRKLWTLTGDDYYFDKYNQSTIKIESSVGPIPVIEILMTLAAEDIPFKWIKCNDATAPKVITFAILKSPSDAEKLIKRGHLDVTEGRLAITKPLQYCPMPLNDRKFELAWCRWWRKIIPPESEEIEPMFLLTRRRNTANKIALAAPLLGSLWTKRFDDYYNDIPNEWSDARIQRAGQINVANKHATPSIAESEESGGHVNSMVIRSTQERQLDRTMPNKTHQPSKRAKAPNDEMTTRSSLANSKRIVLPPRAKKRALETKINQNNTLDDDDDEQEDEDADCLYLETNIGYEDTSDDDENDFNRAVRSTIVIAPRTQRAGKC